jgi:hypothetical protein
MMLTMISASTDPRCAMRYPVAGGRVHRNPPAPQHTHLQQQPRWLTKIDDDDYDPTDVETPFVFVHGIGIGLIVKMPLIDALLQTGRPIFLPKIPFVSVFRPLQSLHAVLQPAVVCSTMAAMLATHGFMRTSWVGRSYGTTWLAYLCKYASHVVVSVLFLDPICFCLHVPSLAKSFVYQKPSATWSEQT